MEYLHYKTYLSMLDRCENLEIFRNFFVKKENGKVVDLLDDGDNSCASFVSNILYINFLIKSPCATVSSMEKILLDSNWKEFNNIENINKGDLIIWEKDINHTNRHFGIYIGNNNCIQNDAKLKKTKIEKLTFRKIEKIFVYTKKDE